MAEYIEREAAIRGLLNDVPEQVFYSREDAADCIRYIPPADVAPVRHGRWIKRPDSRICSCCGYHYDYFGGKDRNYCAECGAKMDGT